MNMTLRYALAFALLAASAGQVFAQPTAAVFPPPASFYGAHASVGLCNVVLESAPISFALSEDDGSMVITAHVRSQSQAEDLRAHLVGSPFIAAPAESQIQRKSDGSSDVTVKSRLATPTMPEVGVSGTAVPHSELLPLLLVNDLAVETGLTVERFLPDSPVFIGPYWLRITQFSVSGTCEQFTALLGRLRPHSESVVPTSNRLTFESASKRPLRWSAELHLRSLD